MPPALNSRSCLLAGGLALMAALWVHPALAFRIFVSNEKDSTITVLSFAEQRRPRIQGAQP